MLHRPGFKFAIAALLLLQILAALPVAEAANTPIETTTAKEYPEDFEGFAPGASPSASWYAVNTAGTGTNQVVGSTVTGGARAWSIADTVSVTYTAQMQNTGAGVNLCTAGQHLIFTFAETASLGALQGWELRLSGVAPVTGSQPTNTFGIIIAGQTGNDALSVYVKGSTTSTLSVGTISANTAINVDISAVNCGAGTAGAQFVFTGGATGTFTPTDSTGFSGIDFDRLSLASTSTTLPTGALLVDNIQWTGAPLPAPTVTAISPVRGSALGGTPVTITGTGFKTGATVAIDGSAATSVNVVSGTTITATTGGHVAASGLSVVVTNPDGQTGTKTNAYQYDAAPTPVITALAPNRGEPSGGTIINVTGSNFRSGFTATFDGEPAFSTTFVSSTRVQIVSPPHDEGGVLLELCNSDGSCDSETYTYDDGSGTSPGEAQEFVEDFEDDPLGNAVPTADWYTVDEHAGTTVVNDGGNRVLQIGGGAPGFIELVLQSSACPGTISMDIREIGSVFNQGFRLSSSTAANYAAGESWASMQAYEAGSRQVRIDIIDTSFDGSVAIGNSVAATNGERFSMTCTAGGAGTGSVTASIAGTATTTATAGVCNGLNNPPNSGCSSTSGDGALRDDMMFLRIFSGTQNPAMYVDNIQFNTVATSADAGSGTCIFCSAHGEDNFGYDFVEDVVFSAQKNGSGHECRADGDFGVEPSGSIGIVPCYKLTGSDTNFAYLAKSWSPGVDHVVSHFVVEATSDGASTIFRSAFGISTNEPSDGTKGNGKDTGEFAEHIEARFEEIDNNWNIKLQHVSVSNDVTSRTTIPGSRSFVGGSPGTPTLYSFEIDTSVSPPRAYLKKGLEQTDIFAGGVALPGYWSGVTFRNHWFIGYNSAVVGDASTRLDPGDTLEISTCIYALGATATANGNPGRIPPPDNDEDGLPDLTDPDDDNDDIPDVDDPTPGPAPDPEEPDPEAPDETLDGPFGQAKIDLAEALHTSTANAGIVNGFMLVLSMAVGVGLVLLGLSAALAAKGMSMGSGFKWFVGGSLVGIIVGIPICFAIGWWPVWVLFIIGTLSIIAIGIWVAMKFKGS